MSYVRLLAAAAVVFCLVGPLRAESGPSQIPRLIEALDDENVRYGASVALARLGEKAVPALRMALASGKPDRRVWSAFTLGEIGPAADSAVGDLTKALGDAADSALRAAAAQALGKIGPGAASSVGPLAKLLTDGDAQVRQRAAIALGRIGPRASQAAPQLVAALKGDTIRPSARTALVRIGESAAGVLLKSLDDDRVRFDVSAILREVAPEVAKQRGLDGPTRADLTSLRLVLHDAARSARDRATAAAGLAVLDTEGVEMLIAAFDDPRIAGAAAAAFAKAPESAVAPLIEALSHEQPGVRAAAAEALEQMGPAAHEAVPHLVRLFGDSDHDVRYRAVRALDAFGQKAAAAVPELTRLVLDPKQREPARQWAILALVNTLPETHDAVVKALIQASRDKGNYGVSSLARQQLRKIDPAAAKAAGIR